MLEIWISRGYILAVTEFVKKNKHVSRHPRVSSRKQKKLFLENCFNNLCLDL